jgi:hypothetical protein
MDQLKEFLKQCVKYRFWIAIGVSLLVPMIGYFVGAPAMWTATDTQEKAIKAADTDVKKYTTPNLPNAQYQPIVADKKAVLEKDVDATWRKLFAVQEPMLRWPEQVEPEFRKWGRKWPQDVDRGQVQKAIIDYTIDYPNFVSKVYKTFQPWNPEDGSGIVAAPDEKLLMMPAPFTAEAPPELGAVWAEQERLWVMTALLDVVAKANASVGAKDWDTAIIKQINAIEVGTSTAQDQKSLAKGIVLVEAPVINPDGTAAAPAAAAAPAGGGNPGGPEAMMSSMMGNNAKAGTVYSLPTTPDQQFKILPVRMTVLVDQSHLPDFLVGLENSPMTIQVMETELAKPLAPVVKPVYGERLNFGMGGYGAMMGGPGMDMEGPGGRNAAMMNMMNRGGPGMPGGGRNMMEMMSGYGPMSGGNQAPAPKKGTDIRSKDMAKERKDQAKKEANAAKNATKSKVDLYFNIIEVTVYGQARFYNAPPAPPQEQPSTSQAAAPTAPAETPKAEVPAAEAAKTEAPKSETPSKPETPAATAPAPAPDATKAETPKAEAPKAEAPPTTKP